MISNFSKLTLLKNLPIIVRTEDNKIFVFNMPTLEDEVSNVLNYDFFYGFCTASLTTLTEKVDMQFDSKYSFLLAVLKTADETAVTLLSCLKKCIQSCEYVDDSLYCGDYALDKEIFDLLCLYISVASGCVTWDEFTHRMDEKNMTEEEAEWERRKRANQAKINAAKAKAGKGTNLEDIVMAILYEYNMSLQEVYQLNKFGISSLYNAIILIDSGRIQATALGTGNMAKNSKYSYWTNKK